MRPNASEYASRDDWIFDTMLAIVSVTFILAPYLVVIALYGPVSSGRYLVIAALAGLALCASVILRRHHPMVFMAAVAVFTAVHVILVPLPFSMLVAIPAAVHAVSRYIRQGVLWVLIVWIPIAAAYVARWYLAYDASDSLLRVAAFGLLAFIGIILTAYAVGRRGYDLAEARGQEIDEAVELSRSAAVGQLEEYYAADVTAQAEWVGQLQHAFGEVLTSMVDQIGQARSYLPAAPSHAVAALDGALGTGESALADLDRMMDASEPPEVTGAESDDDWADGDWADDDYDDQWADDGQADETWADDAWADDAWADDDSVDEGAADDQWADEAWADQGAADDGAADDQWADDEWAGRGTPDAGWADDGYDSADGQQYADDGQALAAVGWADEAGAYADEAYGDEDGGQAYTHQGYGDQAYSDSDYPDRDSADQNYADAYPAATATEDWGPSTIHLPSATLGDVPKLVRAAGAKLYTRGRRRSVDAVLGVTIYRIVEEALDNVRRHAGPDAAPRVYFDWGDEDVEVSVVNDPTAYRAPASDRAGEGLDTMAERAEAVGGVLETGPTENGGFSVWASLPYDWEHAAAAAAPEPAAAGWADEPQEWADAAGGQPQDWAAQPVQPEWAAQPPAASWEGNAWPEDWDAQGAYDDSNEWAPAAPAAYDDTAWTDQGAPWGPAQAAWEPDTYWPAGEGEWATPQPTWPATSVR